MLALVQLSLSGHRSYEMKLVVPAREHLPEYIAALQKGWSGNTINTRKTAQEELARIEADADAFLAGMTDRNPIGKSQPSLMARNDLAFQVYVGGCGMRASAEALTFDGNPARQIFHTMYSVT